MARKACVPLVAGFILTLALLTPTAASDRGCAALTPPVDAAVTAGFAPLGSYGGHWGIDYGVPEGTRVAAAAAGTVTFAGSVAGMLTVTIDHGGGLRSSYSYLSEVAVASGGWVAAGRTLGLSGLHHDVAALHFSTRLDGVYQDPVRWLRCVSAPSAALRLASAYPLRRATRHPRRDV